MLNVFLYFLYKIRPTGFSVYRSFVEIGLFVGWCSVLLLLLFLWGVFFKGFFLVDIFQFWRPSPYPRTQQVRHQPSPEPNRVSKHWCIFPSLRPPLRDGKRYYLSLTQPS